MNEIKTIWGFFNVLTDEQLINLVLTDYKKLKDLCMLLTIEYQLKIQESEKIKIIN
jgi:hypothetical protein